MIHLFFKDHVVVFQALQFQDLSTDLGLSVGEVDPINHLGSVISTVPKIHQVRKKIT